MEDKELEELIWKKDEVEKKKLSVCDYNDAREQRRCKKLSEWSWHRVDIDTYSYENLKEMDYSKCDQKQSSDNPYTKLCKFNYSATKHVLYTHSRIDKIT